MRMEKRMEGGKEQSGQNTRNLVLGMFKWELRWDFKKVGLKIWRLVEK